MTANRNPAMRWLAWVVTALTAVASLAGWQMLQHQVEREDLDHFRRLVEDGERGIRARLADYEDTLYSGASLFQATATVERMAWRRFVESLDSFRRLPGMRGLGYIASVRAAELPPLVEALRSDGAPDFAPHPAGARSEYFIVQYLEPADANPHALGLDIATIDEQCEAAVAARDEGRLAMSRRSELIPDPQHQPAFVLLLPLYRHGQPTDTIAARRAAHRGWIFAPFIAGPIIEPLLSDGSDEVAVEVSDHFLDNPVFSSRRDGGRPAADLTLRRDFAFAGQTWAMTWTATSAFASSPLRLHPPLALAAGLSISALLGALFINLSRTRARALALAGEMTSTINRSEARIRLIIDHALDAIITTDGQGRITAWNPQAERLFGWRQQEVIGQELSATIIPKRYRDDDSSMLRRQTPGEEQSAGNSRRELRVCERSGREFPAEAAVSVVNVDGVVSYSVFLNDISERKRIDAVREDSERRFRNLVTHAPVGIFQADAEGRCQFINQRYSEISGLSAAEAMGDGWQRIIHPDDAVAVFAQWARTAREGCEFAREFRFCTADGAVRWVALSAIAMRETAGDANPIIGFLGTVVDVTDRKSAEQERQRLSAMLEASSDFVGMADAQGRVLYVNGALRRCRGLAPDAGVAGLTLADFHPPAAAAMILSEALPTVASDGAWIGETAVRSTDRGEIPVSSLILCNKSPTGEVEYFFTIMRDITERKLADDELRRAKELAVSAGQAKGDFLAVMSHEIRTPMNGVIGMTGLLLDTALNKDQRGMVETVRTCADSLLTIINDILDFSKIEAGKLELERIDFDLRQVIEEAVSLLAEKAQSKGLDLACVINADAPVAVNGDPGRLRQVLVNLIANAVKFTAKGEVVVRVKLESMATSGLVRAIRGILPGPTDSQPLAPVRVRFEISDSGIGIPPEAQGRLFKSFTQADSSTTRKFGGTGLGLAICKRLVELMDGEIGLDSVPGQGSTFHFTVPLVPRTVALLPLPKALAGVAALVVDDNATTRGVIQELLRGWGMRGDGASDGEDALRRLRQARQDQRPYRVAVVDFAMPGMDGLALSKAIKGDRDLHGTQVVLLTALLGPQLDSATVQHGIAATVSKPVRQSHLCDALVEVLTGEREATRALTGAFPILPPRLRGRVLVAEDNAVNQRLAVALLAKLGCHADVVGDGVEALAALAQMPYDLVLLDCQMPELDGYQVASELRRREAATPQSRRLPLIAMTANAMDGDRERCLAAGMDDYVAKPVRIDALALALGRHLPAEIAPPPPLPAPATTRIAAAGDPPLVDRGIIDRLRRELGGGDPTMTLELIEIYVRDAPQQLATIVAAQAAGDRPALKLVAHRLKGASLNFGLRRLATRCAALEASAASAEAAQLGADCAVLKGLLDDTLAEIARVSDELRGGAKTT